MGGSRIAEERMLLTHVVLEMIEWLETGEARRDNWGLSCIYRATPHYSQIKHTEHSNCGKKGQSRPCGTTVRVTQAPQHKNDITSLKQHMRTVYKRIKHSAPNCACACSSVVNGPKGIEWTTSHCADCAFSHMQSQQQTADLRNSTHPRNASAAPWTLET